jgi:hypothetical protein
MVKASGFSTQLIKPGEIAYAFNESILVRSLEAAGSFFPECR